MSSRFILLVSGLVAAKQSKTKLEKDTVLKMDQATI